MAVGGMAHAVKGVGMVLVRNIVEVQYGHMREVLRCYDEMNEIARSRGWKLATIRIQSGAKTNVVAADIEYDSMTEWEADQEATYGDPEFMKVLREAAQHCVQGTAAEEIWMEAPHIA